MVGEKKGGLHQKNCWNKTEKFVESINGKYR